MASSACACMSSRRLDNIQHFVLITYSPDGLITYACFTSNYIHALRRDLETEKTIVMPKNILFDYSEELATKCEALCKSIKGNANAVFQLRKSSSSVFANVTEAQYPQSLADMLSKFKIARKECAETESWLKMVRKRSSS